MSRRIRKTLGILILLGLFSVMNYGWAQMWGIEMLLKVWGVIIVIVGLCLLAVWLIFPDGW